jgi:hypothetical protein
MIWTLLLSTHRDNSDWRCAEYIEAIITVNIVVNFSTGGKVTYSTSYPINIVLHCGVGAVADGLTNLLPFVFYAYQFYNRNVDIWQSDFVLLVGSKSRRLLNPRPMLLRPLWLWQRPFRDNRKREILVPSSLVCATDIPLLAPQFSSKFTSFV